MTLPPRIRLNGAKRRRLCVAALRNNAGEMVDLARGQVIEQIENLKAPQGIGFSTEFNRLADPGPR